MAILEILAILAALREPSNPLGAVHGGNSAPCEVRCWIASAHCRFLGRRLEFVFALGNALRVGTVADFGGGQAEFAACKIEDTGGFGGAIRGSEQ